MNQTNSDNPLNISHSLDIPDTMLKKWQNILDVIAQVFDIPSALIMRLVETDIEVFLSSQTQGNPYQKGAKEHFWNSGLYCETVIRSNQKLLVPNALKIEQWKNNPDIKLNMISYLGYPLVLPNNVPFGTICILDKKENRFPKIYQELLLNYRDLIQMHLELAFMNQSLGEKNKRLTDYIEEIKTLRGIIPICANCKKIRDDKGYWTKVEKYIEDHSDAKFSHGLCSDCLKELYGDQDWFREPINSGH